MQRRIDIEINQSQMKSLQEQNRALIKQNELLKKQVQQIKQMHSSAQKDLSLYRKMAFSNPKNGDPQNQVLQMQHERIVELETQLAILQQKYNKMVKSGGSGQQTSYAVKCKEYQKRFKQSQVQHHRQLNTLKQKLMKQNAVQLVQSKRIITSPGQLKKSSLAVRKFV